MTGMRLESTYHGRVPVHRRPLPPRVLKGGNLSMQRRRRLLNPLVVRTPEDGCCVGAVVDERSADRDAPFLITLARFRERSRESESVEVVHVGGRGHV